MKLLQVFIIAICAISALADKKWSVDWTQVRARQDEPGFWDNRAFKPHMMPNPDNTRNGNGRIVNGWIVDGPGTHPYQAGLLLRVGSSLFLCGGSIICENVILSAAHCIEGVSSTQVIAGAHRLLDNERTQQVIDVPRNRHYMHSDYNPRYLTNDVSLLYLPTRLVFNEYVQSITLPMSSKLQSNRFVGEEATLR